MLTETTTDHTMTPSADRAHRSTERGASLVEFAFVFPILILLMMSVIDFGVNFGNKVQGTHAAREGARAGSVGKALAPTGHAIGDAGTDCRLYGFAVDATVNTGTTVTSDQTTASQNLACFTKYRAHVLDADIRVKALYMDDNGLRTIDFTHATRLLNKYSIIVCTSTRAYSLTGLLNSVFKGKFLHSREVIKTGATSTYTQYDGTADGVIVTAGTTATSAVAYMYTLPFEETPLTGDSWAFCKADDPTNG